MYQRMVESFDTSDDKRRDAQAGRTRKTGIARHQGTAQDPC